MQRLYFDHLNQARVSDSVRAAVRDLLSEVGNPSSLHAEGRCASARVEKARAQVAGLVGARSEEVIFTSSGTEANAWALTDLAEARCKAVRPSTSSGRTAAGSARTGQGRHIVVSAVEHLSILQTAQRMEKEGWAVTRVPVDRFGRVDPERVEAALTPETVLVSVQWANGEVGTLQPIEEIARRVTARGIRFHSDAVAAAGEVAVDFQSFPGDALSVAGNVWGGLPGAGALILRKGARIQPLFAGGAQEDGRRAGTENLIGIVAMGEAAAAAARELPALAGALVPLRDRLIRGILEGAPEAGLNGHPTERLPGHLSVSFPGVDGEALVLALDARGVAVGLGSACSFRTRKASHVLRAMGVEDARALGAITLTLGPGSTLGEVDRLLEILPKALAGQKSSEVTACGSA